MGILRNEIFNIPHPLPLGATSPTRGEVKEELRHFLLMTVDS